MRLLLFLVLYIFMYTSSYAYTPDFARDIPGSVDVDDAMEEIMKPQEEALEKLENEKLDLELKMDVLNKYKATVSAFEDANKLLYGFDTPFRDKVATSSDENMLTATVDRSAQKGTYNVEILELATPDSFYSKAISKDDSIPAGIFTLEIGSETYPISFGGGSLEDLKKTLDQETDKVLETKILPSSSEAEILQITVKELGTENKIHFTGDLSPLLYTNILTDKALDNENQIDFRNLQTLTRDYLTSTRNTAYFPAKTKGIVDLSKKNIKLSSTSTLKFSLMIEDSLKTKSSDVDDTQNEEEETEDMQDSSKEDTLSSQNKKESTILMEGATLEDVTVEGGGFITNFDFDALRKKDKKNPDLKGDEFLDQSAINFVVKVETLDGVSKEYPILYDGEQAIDLSQIANKTISSVSFSNFSNDKDVTIENAFFDTQNTDTSLRYAHPVSNATDALFTLDGVEITRPTNLVDDLLKGVTLNLKNKTTIPVVLTIDLDYELIQNVILNWVVAYNDLMLESYTLTSVELDYKTPEPLHERKKEDLENGVLSSEISFRSIYSKYRELVGLAYLTSDPDLKLLTQLGIYTKKIDGSIENGTETWENIKKGVLTVDTDELMNKLQEYGSTVSELFYYDTDDDKEYDSGISIKAKAILDYSLNSGGLFSQKDTSLRNDMKRKDETIQRKKEDMEDYEQRERAKLIKMNSAVKEGYDMQQRFNNTFNTGK